MGFGPLLRAVRGSRTSGHSRDAGCPGCRAGRPGWRRWLLQVLECGAGFLGFWPDIRARAGCPGPVDLAWITDVVGEAPGAGCPGSRPDVRGLEGDLAFFRWFSSSVNLVTCPSSCTSPG